MGISHKNICEPGKLKRTLGLFQTTFCGIGIILGAGIYVLIGIAAGYAGNAVWISFLLASFLAVFTGLGYAELSSIFKTDAGEYEYAKVAFNEKIAKIVGLLVIFTGITTAATVALGFGSYVNALSSIPIIIAALALLAFMSYINFKGIKDTSYLNIVFTFIEAGGLLIVILLGIKYFGSVNYLETTNGLTGIFKATALAFFAFTGYEAIVKLAEETKNPTKTIPRAVILSIIITSILYVLVAVSAISVIGWENLSQAKAPLAEVAKTVFGSPAFFVLGLIALASTANTVLMALVTTSRTVYGMAEQKSLPRALMTVHKAKQTPWLAILMTFIFSVGFALIRNIEFVANVSNIFIFLTFALINAALIVLRYTMPDAKRKFTVPLNIGKFPVLIFLGVLVSLFMLYFSIVNAFFAL